MFSFKHPDFVPDFASDIALVRLFCYPVTCRIMSVLLMLGTAGCTSPVLQTFHAHNSTEMRALNLQQSPQDIFILENRLLTHLEAGTYARAVTLGLQHLEPQFLGELNLRLVIQAARLKTDYELAHELIRLGRLLYPRNPAFEIEDRLLKLAQRKCSHAIKPIQNPSLSEIQRQIFAQIRARCSTAWKETVTLSAWLGKPLRRMANIHQLYPEPNSLIDQTCTVFSVGCGPILLESPQQNATQIYGQAVWNFRHLRKDKLTERVRLLLEQGQSLDGSISEAKAFAQYEWQIYRQRLTVRPSIVIGVQKKNRQNAATQNQTTGAIHLATEVPAGPKVILTSSASYTVNKQNIGHIQHRVETTGLRFMPHNRLTLSYANGQEARFAPASDVRGNSKSTSDALMSTFAVSNKFQFTLSQQNRTEHFDQTLYYLTSPHKIREHKLAMRMDISLKTDMKVWIETEAVKSHSADPIYNFRDTRLAVGFQMPF